MKVLGIETSCDETAICVLEADGGTLPDRPGQPSSQADSTPFFKVLGNALYSQIKIHAKYGGVFPNLAKREHALNATPLLEQALKEANLLVAEPLQPSAPHSLQPEKSEENLSENLSSTEISRIQKVQKILEREPGLADMLLPLLQRIKKPDINLIAVTAGPGLEPALWVGINFALALGMYWDIAVMPTNHMEGHILSPLLKAQTIEFPAIALLISGGHTELVLVKSWTDYTLVGQTRDDAIGEAFDKVARVLSLPYPGGPEISKLAEIGRKNGVVPQWKLPRPMIHSDDLDFSFSGIKTAVLYTARDITARSIEDLNDDVRVQIALEFENAVTEVLLTKTHRALEQYGAKTLIIGGGVIANTHIRQAFEQLVNGSSHLNLLLPDISLSTDNAVMIAMAGYFDFLAGKQSQTTIKATGNLAFT